MNTDFTGTCWICSLNLSKTIERVHSTGVSPDNQFSRLRSSLVFLVETAVSVVEKSVLLLLKIRTVTIGFLDTDVSSCA